MSEIAAWAAPAATMIAAMMTAANLGARITGWGFVVFTAGSLLWSYIGISTDQQNLLLTNGFLTLVNLVGVWRWLGRQAKFEDGSQRAAIDSSKLNVPSLCSAAGLSGRKIVGNDGADLGEIVDAMLRADRNDIAYFVVSDGGTGGVGEHLRAARPEQLSISTSRIEFCGDQADFHALEILQQDKWPAKPPPLHAKGQPT